MQATNHTVRSYNIPSLFFHALTILSTNPLGGIREDLGAPTNYIPILTATNTLFNNILHPDNIPTSTKRKPKHNHFNIIYQSSRRHKLFLLTFMGRGEGVEDTTTNLYNYKYSTNYFLILYRMCYINVLHPKTQTSTYNFHTPP